MSVAFNGDDSNCMLILQDTRAHSHMKCTGSVCIVGLKLDPVNGVNKGHGRSSFDSVVHCTFVCCLTREKWEMSLFGELNSSFWGSYSAYS